MDEGSTDGINQSRLDAELDEGEMRGCWGKLWPQVTFYFIHKTSSGVVGQWNIDRINTIIRHYFCFCATHTENVKCKCVIAELYYILLFADSTSTHCESRHYSESKNMLVRKKLLRMEPNNMVCQFSLGILLVRKYFFQHKNLKT